MKTVGFCMIGGGFMGKLHTLSLNSYPVYFYPPAAEVRKVCFVDANPAVAREGVDRYGYERCETDWRKILDDDAIDAVDVATPNFLHKEIVLAVVAAGKHVFCEKPLAMNAADAREMDEAAKKAGVVHAVGHNNRALSGIRFLKQLMERGELGDIYSLQMRYVQSWGSDPKSPMQWRFDSSKAGSGTLGDTGSHALDIGRYLLGEAKRVAAVNRTFVTERPVAEGALLSKLARDEDVTGTHAVDVDDDTKVLLEYESGVTATMWSSRFCRGHEDTLDIEIYGSGGAARFSRERPNELQFFSASAPEDLRGFRTVKMGPQHPYGEMWPMADLGVGYVEQKCVDFKHFFEAVAAGDPSLVSVDFHDGYKICQLIDAILLADKAGAWVDVASV